MQQDKFDGGVLEIQYCLKKKYKSRKLNLTQFDFGFFNPVLGFLGW
jgi:hypothetical protein